MVKHLPSIHKVLGLILSTAKQMNKQTNKKPKNSLLAMVADTCNPRIWEVEIGGSQGQGQPGLHNSSRPVSTT
jgi:hypothetical protein